MARPWEGAGCKAQTAAGLVARRGVQRRREGPGGQCAVRRGLLGRCARTCSRSPAARGAARGHEQARSPLLSHRWPKKRFFAVKSGMPHRPTGSAGPTLTTLLIAKSAYSTSTIARFTQISPLRGNVLQPLAPRAGVAWSAGHCLYGGPDKHPKNRSATEGGRSHPMRPAAFSGPVHWTCVPARYSAARRSVSTTGRSSTSLRPHQPAASASTAPASAPASGTQGAAVQVKSKT